MPRPDSAPQSSASGGERLLLPGKEGWRFAVSVRPGSRRDEIVGLQADALKVAITAPPEKGKANKALCRLLAREMGVPPSAVSVSRGPASRHKEVVVAAGREIVLGFLRRFKEEP